jgi:RNA polymerase sigma-70 factor (ECF subfamily)
MQTSYESFTDEELARRALAGAASCFEEIVRRHQVPLLRFLNRRFPSRRDAEDILQEAFLKAWQSLDRYDPKYAFRTWLYTIAYRLTVSRGRKLSVDEPLPVYDLAGAAPSPTAAAEREDQRCRLWGEARKVLSEEQYLVLWLHYVDEIPAGEIAQILNRSWVSVKTLMHRARKKLMPCLQEPGERSAAVPGHAEETVASVRGGVRPSLRPLVQPGEP